MIAYAVAGIATIGYLSALAMGPAAVVSPAGFSEPSSGRVLGLVVLKEKSDRRQLAGLAVALLGATLLATAG